MLFQCIAGLQPDGAGIIKGGEKPLTGIVCIRRLRYRVPVMNIPAVRRKDRCLVSVGDPSFEPAGAVQAIIYAVYVFKYPGVKSDPDRYLAERHADGVQITDGMIGGFQL